MPRKIDMYFGQINKSNMIYRSLRQVIACLSFVVILAVFWSLKLTGIGIAGEAFCGMEEHAHDELCMPRTLICTLEEEEPHIHTESCLQRVLVCQIGESEGHTHNEACDEKILTCTQEEFTGHVHGSDCYSLSGEYVCGMEASEEHTHSSNCYGRVLDCVLPEMGHVHGESCYTSKRICTLEESEGHTHGDGCWEIAEGYGCGKAEAEGHLHGETCYAYGEQICSKEEHVHDESCYSDLSADLETSKDWEKSMEDIRWGMTSAENVILVAKSQLDYKESTLNFVVDNSGVRRGITRYGQWYGNPYGDWSTMFASFCLHYAGVEDLPANAGPEAMRLEWEEEGFYQAADEGMPEVGNLIFLCPEEADTEENQTEIGLTEAETRYFDGKDTAAAVAIITEVTEADITVIQGDWEDTVSERTLKLDDPTILGYGLVPERSPFTMLLSPRAGTRNYLGRTINYNANMFTDGRSFVIYAVHAGQHYALISRPASGMEATVVAVPIEIDADGSIYTEETNINNLLWTFSRSGNNYVIQNVATGRYLHPGGDNAVIYDRNWPTALRARETGAQFVHTENANNVGIYFNGNQQRFETIGNKNDASTLYFGAVERCTVWLDGTNGGLSSLGGSQNQGTSVPVSSEITLPMQWLSPTKYNYQLRGWYDVTHNQYYAPGEKVTITENTVFYADWMASTYDIGQYNAYVANTVSTNSFITTQLFDYNYLFNVLSADSAGTISGSSHSENWSIVRDENVEYENRETLNFIFLDYGDAGPLDYPNNRQSGVNEYPGAGIVTGGIYNSAIGEALFSTGDRVPGKVYLGTADHLFQIMDDPSNSYYGYYYYDSARNAASYNQSAGRFYVYDYLEATSAELSAAKSDFLPLNSPYANTNGQQVGTYTADDEHANMTNYVYDAKFTDSNNKVSTNYAFGMKMDIRFYLPNSPGEGGNQDVYGNDMHFHFSGDDDLWVLVDGKLALDIGGIHQAETGDINFSTGEVMVQDKRNNALSEVVSALEPGEHTLTVMYLERGASHSNCAIYFNLAPRFQLGIQKEDVLTRDFLNGAQFSVFRDLECTIPAELWESHESYLQGDPATNTFTVKNGSANMWGMGAGNTYYIRETCPPDDENYGFPNGIIRMVLDKRGAATYSVMILDEGNGISGGFTVHGFRVDEETQQAYIIATNAPKWVKEVTTVQARKLWDDGQDHSGQSVTVYLTIHDPDGTVRRLQKAQLSDETDWQHLWENLPKYHEDGTEIVYGVEEAYVSGYYSKVEKVDTYSVTTSSWTATTSLENGRTYLLKTNRGYLSTLNNSSDTGFKWVDEATAKQSNLAQWVVTANGNTRKLTNKAGQTITIYNSGTRNYYASTGGENNNSKQYLSYSVSNNQIRLYYDTTRDYYLTSSMNADNKFTTNTSSNRALLFTPMTLIQSTTTKPAEGEHAYQITNTPLQTETSMTVYKQWRIDSDDDPTLYEQSQVTVKLLANGKDTGRTVTLSLKNGWTDVFRGLPYQDNEGAVIQYTVEESWSNKDWKAEYGPVNTVPGDVPTYNTTVTNVYRWGHGVELPSTGSAARLGYILCGSGILLLTLVYGFVSRRKRERRTE